MKTEKCRDQITVRCLTCFMALKHLEHDELVDWFQVLVYDAPEDDFTCTHVPGIDLLFTSKDDIILAMDWIAKYYII